MKLSACGLGTILWYITDQTINWLVKMISEFINDKKIIAGNTEMCVNPLLKTVPYKRNIYFINNYSVRLL